MIKFLMSLFLPRKELVSCKYKVCPNCKFRVLGNRSHCMTCGFNLKEIESEGGLTSAGQKDLLISKASDHFDTDDGLSLGQKAELV